MKHGVLVSLAFLAAVPNQAHAAVTLVGDYVSVTINDAGSLSSLKHAPAGDGNFGVNDYITPGTPHEGFSVNSVQTGFRANGNASSNTFVGGPTAVLAGADALGYSRAAGWTGQNAQLSIAHKYLFNAGDERVRVITTLTALTDLTNLAFARSVDPDPDVNTGGGFNTNNQRGNLLFDKEDFIGAAGPSTGLTLGLVNNTPGLTTNTLIGSSCCANIDPYTVLAGGVDSSSSDSSINLAFQLGNLTQGSSITFEYFYAVGDKIGSVGGGVPEPATWMMMILGFGLVGAALRRRTVRVSYAA